MSKNFILESLACLVGIIIGGIVAYNVIFPTPDSSDEYHTHADFLIQIDGNFVDLSKPELMTTSLQQLHKHAHLHDDNGKVLHLHEENISFVEFLSSLGTTLTNNCIIIKDGDEVCANDDKTLVLYVNDNPWTDDILNYIPQDLDRILLYYGDKHDLPDSNLLEGVANDACLYSGSCPERGIAPPESCGLTCEL